MSDPETSTDDGKSLKSEDDSRKEDSSSSSSSGGDEDNFTKSSSVSSISTEEDSEGETIRKRIWGRHTNRGSAKRIKRTDPESIELSDKMKMARIELFEAQLKYNRAKELAIRARRRAAAAQS